MSDAMIHPLVDVFMLENPYTNTKNSGDSSTVWRFFRDIMGLGNLSPTNTSKITDLTPADRGWTFLDDSKTVQTSAGRIQQDVIDSKTVLTKADRNQEDFIDSCLPVDDDV